MRKTFKDYSEFLRFIYQYTQNPENPTLRILITFTKDSFSKEYDERSRTYMTNSKQKAFGNYAGSSIFGNCLDGSDDGVRLDYYMNTPYTPWKVEKVTIMETELRTKF